MIFDLSRAGRTNAALAPRVDSRTDDIPRHHLRGAPPSLPEVSAEDAIGHYTRLSQLISSADTSVHSLVAGSTANSRAGSILAMNPPLFDHHPLSPDETGQGFLACLYELQEILKSVTGGG